jgi:antitoxin component of MazEF toxin-antitoxin module
MPARSDRRILAVGSSKAVALPPDWLRAFRLDVGDEIEVLYDSVVVVKPVALQIDEHFLRKEFHQLASVARSCKHHERSPCR